MESENVVMMRSLINGLKVRTDEEIADECVELDAAISKAKDREAQRCFDSCGLGSRFSDCRLGTYTPTGKEQRQALEKVKTFTRGPIGEGEGLFLAGDPDGGKTHLLAGCLWIAANQGLSVRYLTLKMFFLGCRSAISSKETTEKDFLRELIEIDVLALDDFHQFKSTPGEYQYDMLWMLLDERYANKKATLTSSNLSKSEIEIMLDGRTWRRLSAEVVHVPRTDWGKVK